MSASSSNEVRFISRAEELLRAKGITRGAVLVTIAPEGKSVDYFGGEESSDVEFEEAVEFDADFDVNPAPEVDALADD